MKYFPGELLASLSTNQLLSIIQLKLELYEQVSEASIGMVCFFKDNLVIHQPQDIYKISKKSEAPLHKPVHLFLSGTCQWKTAASLQSSDCNSSN